MAGISLIVTAAILFLGTPGLAQEDRCYVEVEDHALFGNNDDKISDVTMSECKRLCDVATSFTCISLDYTSSRTCYLSANSHVTDAVMYGPHHGATYAYVTECAVEESSEQNEIDESGSEEGTDNHEGRCYQVHHDVHMIGGHVEYVWDVSYEECLISCDLEPSDMCAATSYSTTSRTCMLKNPSQDNDEHISDIPSFIYSEVVDCDSGLPDVISSGTVQVTDGSNEQDSSEEHDSSSSSTEEESEEVVEEKLPISMCDDSSHYEYDTCHNVNDGDLDTWWQVPYSYTGEWIKLVLEEQSHVTRVDVRSYMTTMGQCSVLSFTFGRNTVEKSRDCYESPSAILDTFHFDGVVTSDMTMTCVERCPYGVAGWYLFSEIALYGSTAGPPPVEMTCRQSLYYEEDTCDKLTDGDLDTWWQIPESWTGNWVKFDYSSPRPVQRIDLWSHMLVMGQCAKFRFEFSGGRFEEKDRECVETSTPALDQFYVDVESTDYVTLVCSRRCPDGVRGWYLFAEMTIHDDRNADVIDVVGDGEPDHIPLPIELDHGYIDDIISCSDSSHYQDDTCYHLYDHDGNTWWQVPGSDPGEWMEMRFKQTWPVHRIDVWSHPKRMGQCASVKFEFKHGEEEFELGPCSDSDVPIKQSFRFRTVQTDRVKMTCTKRCYYGTQGWYLFSEVVPYANFDSDYDYSGSGSGSGDDDDDSSSGSGDGYGYNEYVIRSNQGYNKDDERSYHHGDNIRLQAQSLEKKQMRRSNDNEYKEMKLREIVAKLQEKTRV